MRQFVKRALQRIDSYDLKNIDLKKGREFILTASREIDRLETVIDSLPRGILVCDRSHNLILANKAARRFLSIVSYEQARESVWSVISEDLVAEFLAGTLVSADKAEEKDRVGELLTGFFRILTLKKIPYLDLAWKLRLNFCIKSWFLVRRISCPYGRRKKLTSLYQKMRFRSSLIMRRRMKLSFMVTI